MSKLGFHLSGTERHGFGECLKQCADAGNPVAAVFSLDQNVWPDIQTASPTTTYIFRHQPLVSAPTGSQKNGNGKDGPQDIYTGDPAASARNWMDVLMPVWRLNPAHYYAPLNEQDPPDLPAFDWLNLFSLECMKIAEDNHFKLALYAFSSGNPKDVPAPAEGLPFTAADAWQRLIPSLQHAKTRGHILLLHEYGFDTPTLKKSAPNLALRYRASYASLPIGARPLLVISEASSGAGYSHNAQEWLPDVKWYDSELMKDSQVIGCCLYQLGGAENFAELLPQLGDYISSTPTPVESASPIESTASLPKASPDNTEIHPDGGVKIIDSAGHEWSFGASADVGRVLLQDGAQFKGGQGTLLLFHDKKVFTQNGLGEWFVATPDKWEPVPGDPRVKPLISETLAAGAALASVVHTNGHTVVFGIHGSAQLDNLSEQDKQVMGTIKTRVTGYKFMTGHPRAHYEFIINGIQIPAANCMTRLYMDVHDLDQPPSPEKFVHDMELAIQDAWDFGVRSFELHNEPNLFSEWKKPWGSAPAFVGWALDVINRLRANPKWPGIKIVSPGLSPKDQDNPEQWENADKWIDIFASQGLFEACDAVGVHAYWGHRAAMKTEVDGLNFHRYFGRTKNKPIWITEFSNNQSSDPDVEKGQQYRDYLIHLRQNEPRVERAYCFVLSGKDFNTSQESWVRNALASSIPAGVMS